MASELASGGYRIAKSWQYQENLPDPVPSSASPPFLNDFTNNNSFYVSSSLNQTTGRSVNNHDSVVDERNRGSTFLATLFSLTDSPSGGGGGGGDEEPNLRRPLLHSTSTFHRHRKNDDDKMSGGALCCLTLLVIVAQVLLHGLVGLVLYWVIAFHTEDGKSFPFAWNGGSPEKQFNLHPVLMIVGFIYFSGQAMLFYRSCRCCRRIWNKLFHTMFHLLAIPCITLAFIAVLEFHNNRTDSAGKQAPIPNFYSLHSWMGLTTMGLFALQFIVGFFSFLLLLCCESATASFRASLVPVHSAFGLTTFVLAIATACTGFTEKAFFKLSIGYSKWVPYLRDPLFNATTAYAGISGLGPEYTKKEFEESLVINVMAATLVGLAIVMPVLIMHPRFRFRPQRIITVTHEHY